MPLKWGKAPVTMTVMSVDAIPHDDPKAFDDDAWEKSGFHPTLARPFPSMQCTGVVRNGLGAGNRCAKRAVYGASVCLSHGAQIPRVRAKAEAVVMAARLSLQDSSTDAVDWLIELAQNATSDAVRLKATTEILDRAGVRGGSELEVTVTAGESPADALNTRLEKLRERSQAAIVKQNELEGTIVETDSTDTE